MSFASEPTPSGRPKIVPPSLIDTASPTAIHPTVPHTRTRPKSRSRSARWWNESEFVSERWLVGPEGGLANCAISLRPIEGTEVPPIEPIEDAYFDKVGPYYRPQVLLVTPGTSVTLRNQESLCGNFHGRAKKNKSFNRVIAPGEEHTWLAERAEVVPVVCDIQPYVQGAIVVVDTPYYAMTDADGSFRIRDVAPGTYMLRAFHEGLGQWIRRRKVEVDWGQSVSLELRTSATPQ